jgi:hypothetical protein
VAGPWRWQRIFTDLVSMSWFEERRVSAWQSYVVSSAFLPTWFPCRGLKSAAHRRGRAMALAARFTNRVSMSWFEARCASAWAEPWRWQRVFTNRVSMSWFEEGRASAWLSQLEGIPLYSINKRPVPQFQIQQLKDLKVEILAAG